jgi:outer membrane protein OmpA-like peptidoglycan-associated protein
LRQRRPSPYFNPTAEYAQARNSSASWKVSAIYVILFYLFVQQTITAQIQPASRSIPVSSSNELHLEALDGSQAIMNCFDFYLTKSTPQWTKDLEGSRTYSKACDLAITSIVLNPDFTFFCILQSGNGPNWLDAGKWKLTRDSILFLKSDKALSLDFMKSLQNEKKNTYSIEKIVDSTYLYRKNHLIPMVIFNADREPPKLLAAPKEPALKNQTGILSGRISRSPKASDGVSDLKLTLLSAQGNLIRKTTTDPTGYFRFDPLPSDQNYSIGLDENNKGLKVEMKFYLLDARNRVVRVILMNENGKFEFKNLPSDLSFLEILPESDPQLKRISIAGTFLHGPKKAPLSTTRISLLNHEHVVVQNTMTSIFGSFLFMGLSPEEDYTLSVIIADPVITNELIYLVDKSGKVLQVGDAKTGFRYSLLKEDRMTLSALKEEDSELHVQIKGKLFLDQDGAKPLKNIPVDLLNHFGEVIQTSRTDNTGMFQFKHKIDKEVYGISVSDTVMPTTEKKELFLADEGGKIVEKMLSQNGKFRYAFLPNIPSLLTEIVEYDPWLDILDLQGYNAQSQIIVEKIYFKVQDWSITPEAEVILNKVISVLKLKPELHIELSTYTDSRGSDSFNLQLSQKRADSGVKYMISKGISAKRVSGKGYGESRLLNNCSNGVICTEEEHQKNRRAEFKIFRIN